MLPARYAPGPRTRRRAYSRDFLESALEHRVPQSRSVPRRPSPSSTLTRTRTCGQVLANLPHPSSRSATPSQAHAVWASMAQSHYGRPKFSLIPSRRLYSIITMQSYWTIGFETTFVPNILSLTFKSHPIPVLFVHDFHTRTSINCNTMHASHVAILVLVVSAASPVISAPLATRGAASVSATSDVVACGFSTSVFSNVNKGTKAAKRDGPLDDIQVSDVHVKGIISVMNGLFGDVPVDDVQARGFDISTIFRILGTATAGLLVRDDVDDIQARRFGLGNVKGILDTVKNVVGLLVRDDVNDIQARSFDTSTLSNLNKGTQALGARALIRPSDVKGVLGTVKDIAGLLARDDVDDIQTRGFDSNLNKGTQALGARRNPVRPGDVKAIIDTVGSLAGLLVRDDVDDSALEDAFLQAISRRSVSELGARGEVSSIFQAIKDIFQVVSRDVTPEQLIALASLASSPLNTLD
ncbi:hypothetical protein EDB89DRAFT_2229893 [Lactarius sanguifluus]|nr:hypothetical protein EDB89DRAFT_2229893 [Lactarius sanguifluus]